MDLGTTVLGAMGIVLGVLMPVFVVGLILWYKMRRNQQMHETALKLAEKGQPLPPGLFADSGGSHANLRLGVVLTMLGIGICLSLYLVGLKSWPFGIIPLFMGVGYLVVWKIDGSNRATLIESK